MRAATPIRLLAGAALIAVAASLAGCSTPAEPEASAAATPSPSASPTPSASPSPSPEPTPEPTPEPVLLDATIDGAAFVRAWATAGFPSAAADPARFCDGFTSEDPTLVDWMGASSGNGWTWQVLDAVDAATAEATIQFQGQPDSGEYAQYLVAIGGSGTPALCLADIRWAGP